MPSLHGEYQWENQVSDTQEKDPKDVVPILPKSYLLSIWQKQIDSSRVLRLGIKCEKKDFFSCTCYYFYL